MAGLDNYRIALVLASPATESTTASTAIVEEVATGYFLSRDLVLTVRHVGQRRDCDFRVRSIRSDSDKEVFSPAFPVWQGTGDVDAMLLRTEHEFADWECPKWATHAESGEWESAGFAKAASNPETGARQTLPLDGSFATSVGQIVAPELYLTSSQVIRDEWETYWKGLSGAPVFLKGSEGGFVGIVTDANRALSNGLLALPVSRLLDDIRFRSIVADTSPRLPTNPWCLVITPERTPSDLVDQVASVINGFRDSDEHFRDLHQEPIERGILDAIGSVERWADTVEALARADYVIVDVTGFEPAVMLLLGIRSVLRRGVTISVTAGDLRSDDSRLPFNVQETRVLSYADHGFYDALYRAMTEGATNVSKDANYLDLPAYHGVRGPRPLTWADDNATNLLVLCSFSLDYSTFYESKLRDLIRGSTHNLMPLRMLDLRSPRLVGQALYEQIRWSSRCIVDWTEWKPNVFFELGVRLACCEHDPLSIVNSSDIPPASGSEADTPVPSLAQQAMLLALLRPVPYDRAKPHQSLAKHLSAWADPDRTSSGSSTSESALPPAGTFAAAQAGFAWHEEKMLTKPPHIEQRELAERIMATDQTKQPERLVLFSDNEEYDAELQAAVKEKWIAAWLYLRHLTTADSSTESGKSRSDFALFSQFTSEVLSKSMDSRHVALRREIREFLKAERARIRVQKDGEGDE